MGSPASAVTTCLLIQSPTIPRNSCFVMRMGKISERRTAPRTAPCPSTTAALSVFASRRAAATCSRLSAWETRTASLM